MFQRHKISGIYTFSQCALWHLGICQPHSQCTCLRCLVIHLSGISPEHKALAVSYKIPLYDCLTVGTYQKGMQRICPKYLRLGSSCTFRLSTTCGPISETNGVYQAQLARDRGAKTRCVQDVQTGAKMAKTIAKVTYTFALHDFSAWDVASWYWPFGQPLQAPLEMM